MALCHSKPSRDPAHGVHPNLVRVEVAGLSRLPPAPSSHPGLNPYSARYNLKHCLRRIVPTFSARTFDMFVAAALPSPSSLAGQFPVNGGGPEISIVPAMPASRSSSFSLYSLRSLPRIIG
jgi:hypothetical protein